MSSRADYMLFTVSNSSLLAKLIMVPFKNKEFRTSAEAVMKVCGLHFEAIRAIAREQGIEIHRSDSCCIDECLLSELANAHVRQLKSYFNKANRHILELSNSEFTAFVDFCNTFKRTHRNSLPSSWDEIDTNAIREQFIIKVHDTAHRQNNSCKSNVKFHIDRFLQTNEYYTHNLDDNTILKRNIAIERIIKFIHLHSATEHKCTYYFNKKEIAIRITLSARYYVFPDDNDHLPVTEFSKSFSASREIP